MGIPKDVQSKIESVDHGYISIYFNNDIIPDDFRSFSIFRREYDKYFWHIEYQFADYEKYYDRIFEGKSMTIPIPSGNVVFSYKLFLEPQNGLLICSSNSKTSDHQMKSLSLNIDKNKTYLFKLSKIGQDSWTMGFLSGGSPVPIVLPVPKHFIQVELINTN
jgi:hypothetical protein